MKKAWKHELIGSEAEIIGSKNSTLIGIKGKIIDETKNTITIQNKKILKSHITLKIKNQVIQGKDLVGKPEDRLKWKKENKLELL